MLNGVKQDSLRYCYAVAIKKYCESLLEYLANIDQAPDRTVKKDVYALQFSAVYDVFYAHWLQNRDQKVKRENFCKVFRFFSFVSAIF